MTGSAARTLVRFSVPGEPVAKARARSVPLMRGGKPVIGAGGRPVILHHTPDKTVRYENLVKLAAREAMGSRAPSDAALQLTVHAVFTIPASWSQRKRAAAIGTPVTKRPDLDNVVKAVKDGCNGVVWRDDCQVASLGGTRKVYGEWPRVDIEVEVLPLEDQHPHRPGAADLEIV